MFKDGMVGMIQKAKKMQEDMKIAQEEIKSTLCQGESASDSVKITLTGEYLAQKHLSYSIRNQR